MTKVTESTVTMKKGSMTAKYTTATTGRTKMAHGAQHTGSSTSGITSSPIPASPLRKQYNFVF
jgi:hypothetical protein